MQDSQRKAIVVIPTFNEADNIEVVLDRVVALEPRMDVLVVDDASPDGTADIVGRCIARHPDRISLIQREGKLGLGTAYLAGFAVSLERQYTFICEMDADLSHDPSDLARLVQAAMDDKADLVVGSRYVDGVRIINWPLRRLFLSYGAGIYTRAITRMPIKDVTSGFKCFHRRVLGAIDFAKVKSNGYSFQIEMNYRAWKLGYRILEIPIVFTERTEGRSKMSRSIVREATLKVWELRLRALFRRL